MFDLMYVIGFTFVVGFGLGSVATYFSVKHVAKRFNISPK